MNEDYYIDRVARHHPIPERFQKNRRRLDLLIQTTNDFSSNELLTRYGSGDKVIDPEMTAREYLEMLVKSGRLRYEFGRYWHD